jgi:hypothetical protein
MADRRGIMVITVRHYDMIRLSRLRQLHSKKYLILASILLSVFLIGGYALWSKQVWAQYGVTYAKWHQELNAKMRAISVLPTTTVKEQDVILDQFDGVSQRISFKQADLCTVTPLVQWQQRFIAVYESARSDCQKKMTDIVSFQKQLDSVIAYIKNDHELAKIIATATPAGELADGVWGNQVSTWGKAIDSAGKLSVSAAFQPTRQQALDRMTTVKVAWQELIVAHQLKDKVKYIEAQNKLGAAYDGLNDVSVASEKNSAILTDLLSVAYEKSFQ